MHDGAQRCGRHRFGPWSQLRCRRRALAPGCAKKTFASIAILTGVGKLGAVYSGEGEKLA